VPVVDRAVGLFAPAGFAVPDFAAGLLAAGLLVALLVVDRLGAVLLTDAALLAASVVDALVDRRALLGELPIGRARSIALPALVAAPPTALPALTAAPPTALPALVAALPTALPALDPATVPAALPTVSAALPTVFPTFLPTSFRTLPESATLVLLMPATSYAKNSLIAWVSSENAHRSTILPSRMWRISAVRYSKVWSPRRAVALTSAIPCSSFATTS